MDIAAMSIAMNQASVQSAASISIMKMAMNSETQIASQMTDLMRNMVIDTSRGTNIDVRV